MLKFFFADVDHINEGLVKRIKWGRVKISEEKKIEKGEFVGINTRKCWYVLYYQYCDVLILPPYACCNFGLLEGQLT